MKKPTTNVTARFIETQSKPTTKTLDDYTRTIGYLELYTLPYIGVEEYLTPDTQRDAVNLKTGKLEAHNHCKNTSCTMALNWVGKHFGKDYPVLESLSTCGEHQYNAILEVFMKPGQRIQDWQPHVILFNSLFKNAGLPLVAKFGKYRANEIAIIKSLKAGFPVVLGTLITKAGHVVLLYRILQIENQPDIYVVIDPYGRAPNYRETIADYYQIKENTFDDYVTDACNAIWFEETK